MNDRPRDAPLPIEEPARLTTATPKIRREADHYLALMLTAFGLTVTQTRVFLVLTGYPQVGSGTFHIAHTVWGGLLLIIATVVPLLYMDRGSHAVSAVLGGIGAGLFFDEVGKFITRNNDYFYPLAGTIVFAVILGLAIVAHYAARQVARSPDGLLPPAQPPAASATSGDLEQVEQQRLLNGLAELEAAAGRPDIATLAGELRLALIGARSWSQPAAPSLIDRFVMKLARVEARLLPGPVLRRLIVLGVMLTVFELLIVIFSLVLGLAGIHSLTADIPILAETTNPTSSRHQILLGSLTGAANVIALLPLFVALRAFAVGQEASGARWAFYGVIFQLVVWSVLNSYFNYRGLLVATVTQSPLLFLLWRQIRRSSEHGRPPVEETPHRAGR